MWKSLAPPLKLETTASRLAQAPRIYGSNKSVAVPVMASGKLYQIPFIGSLAKDLKEEGVQNVTVKKATFSNTQNGLRIKSWARPSTGFVEGVRFMDSMMRNVQNPIVINQNYCPRNENCLDQMSQKSHFYFRIIVSGVKIKDIMSTYVRGTSSTPVAIKFDCSTKNPCTGWRTRFERPCPLEQGLFNTAHKEYFSWRGFSNVNLTYLNKAAQSFCSNVVGKAVDLVRPNSCP
ncbi:hypothetical protein GQ457_09G026950 [Hibiscus cannabinus]